METIFSIWPSVWWSQVHFNHSSCHIKKCTPFFLACIAHSNPLRLSDPFIKNITEHLFTSDQLKPHRLTHNSRAFTGHLITRLSWLAFSCPKLQIHWAQGAAKSPSSSFNLLFSIGQIWKWKCKRKRKQKQKQKPLSLSHKERGQSLNANSIVPFASIPML